MTSSGTAQIDRTRQPDAGPLPTAAFPPYEEFQLANGLKVFLVHDDRPSVTMRLLVRGGNGQDGNNLGTSDAVAELLTKGTRTRNADGFAEDADFIGARIGASTTADYLAVTATGLRRHFDVMLNLFAEAITQPTFNADELQKYVQEQTTGLKSARARVGFLADVAMNVVLFGRDNPYGAPPTEEMLQKLTPDMLRAYHAKFVVPANSTLAVVAGMTSAELKGKLEKAFSGWSGGAASPIPMPNFPARTGRRIVLVDRPNSVQSAIRVIGRGPKLDNPDFPKVQMMNSIFGAGAGLGNRLTMNLRETHAWTYSPGSAFDANLHTGWLEVQADVASNATDSAVGEILKEMDRMAKEPVAQDEFSRNQQSMIGTYLMSVASPDATANRVQSIEFYGRERDYFQKLVDRYNSTTPADIQRFANEYMPVDNVAIVVVGNAKELRSKLEQYGPVEVWTPEMKPVEAGTAGSGGKKVGDAKAAQTVWDRMVKAMGGAEKMRAVKTLSLSSKLLMGDMEAGTFKRTHVGPKKMRIVMNLGPTEVSMLTDGKRAWRNSPAGKELLEGEEAASLMEVAWLLPESRITEIGGTIALREEQTMEGKTVSVIDVNYPDGTTGTYYIDTKTNLPVAQQHGLFGLMKINGWTTVNGIKLPSAMAFTPEGAPTELKLTNMTYTLNGKVDESIFRF